MTAKPAQNAAPVTKPTDADPFADCFASGGAGEMPSGMKSIDTPDVEGWFSPEPGLVFAGQILSSFTVTDRKGDRDVLVIRLAKPTKAKDAENKDKFIRLDKGGILGVSVTHKLRELMSYVEHQGWCQVECLRKKRLDNGQDMWLYKIGVTGTRSAAPKNAPAQTSDAPDIADDCPF